MSRGTTRWIGGLVGLLAAACLIAGSNRPAGKKAEIRVGTFDSRAVAVAYAHSELFHKLHQSKLAELEKAKAAGDAKKVEALEAWGKNQQAKLHQKGFGSASVKDLLEPIKDSLLGIARTAGVEMLVSKWDVVYHSSEADLRDLTDEIIKPFKPSEKVLGMIKELPQHAPLSEAELEEMEKSHQH